MDSPDTAALPRRFDVITLFPQAFEALTQSGITRRAFTRELCQLECTNPRDFATDAHRTVDDRPYGGGPGMVMMAEPLAAALADIRIRQHAAGVRRSPVLLLSPQGRRLDHGLVRELVEEPALTLVCGRYEGIDQRFIDQCVDLEVSLGDFVVSGGELPAMVLLDAVIRQLPGALNDAASAQEDSFVDGLLDCPHYTRPENWRGMEVPSVLLSGDHAAIARWRQRQSLGNTWLRRPDLLNGRTLGKTERALLESFQQDAHAATVRTVAAL